MPTVVVPFRGVEGKSRLGRLQREARAALAHAMLADVVDACLALGPTVVVAPEGTPVGRGARRRRPGRRAGSRRAASGSTRRWRPAAGRRTSSSTPTCRASRRATSSRSPVPFPTGGLALAAAADGTTNALALSSPDLFEPVYGPGSAARFAALAPSRTVDAPNLVDDVDTVDDLERLGPRVGPHTRAALSKLLGAAA